jgi:glutamate formiminotransferase
MSTWIECVPNFSEGRRQDVIDAIVNAIATTPDVILLDVSSDADHNRTVVTFMGEPSVVVEGAFNGIQEAKKHIDLNQHLGEHPRIGAADVVPFIPLRSATIADCVQAAQNLGLRVGTELELPVYLYESAATRPERRNLADVRRLRFEGLKAAITTDADWTPDYGPAQMGGAGAVAIGARQPLIAFNAYLNTDDVEIAQAIAVAIRESGGGLPYVKALGLFVNGQAQVSINVIDFRQTGLLPIVQAVQAEAEKHGVTITHTELVGLMPRRALIDTALLALGLPTSTHDLILEDRIGNMTGDFREIVFE